MENGDNPPCQYKCNLSILQPICCLTYDTVDKMANLLSIVKNSCELALYEMRKLDGEAEPAREALLKVIDTINNQGKGTLYRFYALLSLMRLEENYHNGKR